MQDQKRPHRPRKCFIALGSNLTSGSIKPHQTLSKSLKLCEAASLSIIKISDWYSTPAYPKNSGPDFVNAVILVETTFSPEQVLEVLHEIESELGRTREKRWGPRICDLDLISYEDMVLPDVSTFRKWENLPLADQKSQTPSELILPHPRLQDRAFVLVPMSDIAPDWRHPVIRKTVKEMINALPQDQLDEIAPFTA